MSELAHKQEADRSSKQGDGEAIVQQWRLLLLGLAVYPNLDLPRLVASQMQTLFDSEDVVILKINVETHHFIINFFCFLTQIYLLIDR